MYFRDIVGHHSLKANLIKQAHDGHVGHALLFIGAEGGGNLALATAFGAYILCKNPGPNDRCGQCRSCAQLDALSHPDLHFSFPIILSDSAKTSNVYLREFNAMFAKNPYLTLHAWEAHAGDGKKKALIPTKESEEIRHVLSLKSFDGGHKVMIIWRADRMNISSANKLLKTLEEPDAKTLIIMVVPDPESLLVTVRSRAQKIRVETASQAEVAQWLVRKYQLPTDKAEQMARVAQGNLFLAAELAQQNEGRNPFFEIFTSWMRAAATYKIGVLLQLGEEVSTWSREDQQQYLEYMLGFLDQSIRYVYAGADKTALESKELDFASKFSPFMTQTDLGAMQTLISKAHYLVERNIHSQLLFLKLGADMCRIFRNAKAEANV